MEKKKLALIIIGTLLAMALVVLALVLWLVPADNNNATDDPTQTTGSAMNDDKTGEEGDETKGDSQEPTVGVEVEIPDETTGNGGNSGTGTGNNGGNSGNTGGNNNTENGGNSRNQEIDFDDLLGNG